MTTHLQKAVLWDPLDDHRVRCQLCNFHCRIDPGQKGHCQVRQNLDGTLYSLNYHALCSAAIDPIEKKPLFHFLPGHRSFSLAAPGCNFRCDFCQNWQISQLPRLNHHLTGRSETPQAIVNAALDHNCQSIAYTYTEPTVFMELCDDVGRLARQKGLANVFVSNGYLSTDAIDLAAHFLDAINVDLKAFSERFYQQRCQARLAPVLDTLRYIAHHTNIWLEVTTLIVPGQNDSTAQLKQIAQFIANDLGPHVPWHVSRFHPSYEMLDNDPTPPETMTLACDLAKDAGLHYVYVGNFPALARENTRCHHCNQTLISRTGFHIDNNLLQNNTCPQCQTPLAGVFTSKHDT